MKNFSFPELCEKVLYLENFGKILKKKYKNLKKFLLKYWKNTRGYFYLKNRITNSEYWRANCVNYNICKSGI